MLKIPNIVIGNSMGIAKPYVNATKIKFIMKEYLK